MTLKIPSVFWEGPSDGNTHMTKRWMPKVVKRSLMGKKGIQQEGHQGGKKTRKKCGQSHNQKLLKGLQDSPTLKLPRKKWKKLALGKGEFRSDI